MTTATAPNAPLPRWLVDAVMGLVASAYLAGRADSEAEVQQVAPVEQDVLYRDEAARFLRCGKTKLDGLVRDGVIASFHLGGRRAFRRADLEAYVAGAK